MTINVQNEQELTDRVRFIVASVLATTEHDDMGWGLDTDLRAGVGFDSLSIMCVLSSAEEEFGVALDDDEAIASTVSVRKLALCIRERLHR